MSGKQQQAFFTTRRSVTFCITATSYYSRKVCLPDTAATLLHVLNQRRIQSPNIHRLQFWPSEQICLKSAGCKERMAKKRPSIEKHHKAPRPMVANATGQTYTPVNPKELANWLGKPVAAMACGRWLWKACGCNGLWPLVVESLWPLVVDPWLSARHPAGGIFSSRNSKRRAVMRPNCSAR